MLASPLVIRLNPQTRAHYVLCFMPLSQIFKLQTMAQLCVGEFFFFVAGLKAKKYQLSVKCDTQHTSGEITMQ